VLLIHGSEDEVVPAWMSEDLEKLFPHATPTLIEGAHHNDLFGSRGADTRAAIAAFLGR
jgi:fermentation-respiration switch protein FrsA (DUF1100 family)